MGDQKVFITYFNAEETTPLTFAEISKPNNSSVEEKIKNIEKFLDRTELDIRRFEESNIIFYVVILDYIKFFDVICNSHLSLPYAFTSWKDFPYPINLQK